MNTFITTHQDILLGRQYCINKLLLGHIGLARWTRKLCQCHINLKKAANVGVTSDAQLLHDCNIYWSLIDRLRQQKSMGAVHTHHTRNFSDQAPQPSHNVI